MAESVNIDALYPDTLYTPDVEEIWEDVKALRARDAAERLEVEGFLNGEGLGYRDERIPQAESMFADVEVIARRRKELEFAAQVLDRVNGE